MAFNKECGHKMDVISNEAVDKYGKVNSVNVELQDSVGFSVMGGVTLCSVEIIVYKGWKITSNNVDCVPGDAL